MIRFMQVLSLLITLIGAMSISLAIWVGLPITGHPVLTQAPVRIALIALTLGLLLLRATLRHRRHKRAAQALEKILITTRTGDGPIVAARMKEALKRLQFTSGATSLYSLPWYVIIGPPGAGKTTALIHSGLDFPDTDTRAVAGFGGTKNCDFWFTRDAVMIDTAGRYTTQDSDEKSDKLSWASFLSQLKSARPNQPINGVVLAFSCEDMMVSSPDDLEAHAEIVHTRLAELHAALKTHIPVYVIFTKADMITGFRQYFGSFNAERRKAVWGVTFQTKDRHEETHRAVSREFSHLLSRLSEEITDRLNEEVDSATRIAIFGFPEQIAMMERNITIFLQRIFGTPQKTRSILRGFYFTSGTQAGTPIDQVLGSLSTQSRAGGLQPAFMSGRGRSYFLHDLLRKVIFEERDWVGYDRRLMRRRSILRGSAKTFIAAMCLGAMAMVGYSFWSNASLVREAAQQTQTYKARATALIKEPLITEPDTRGLLPALDAVRIIPAGYGNPRPQEFNERLGLSRRAGLSGAAVQAYSDSLERLLRPRMMLFMENKIAQHLEEDRPSEAYHALKVYILLAKEQDWRADDIAVQAYFSKAWAEEYNTLGSDADYRKINTHLAAMLELDDRVSPWIKPNRTLVDKVREKAADLPLALQAYSAIRSQAGRLPPVPLTDMLEGQNIDEVFQTTDGRPLESLSVPGLFTRDGYWTLFKDAVANAPTQLERDSWVFGPVSAPVDADPINSNEAQMARLSQDLHTLYAQDFEQAWNAMLTKIEFVPMALDAPEFAALDAAASTTASPILTLVETIAIQTDLAQSLQAAQSSRDTLTDEDFDPVDTLSLEILEGWQNMLMGQAGEKPLDRLLTTLAELRRTAQSQSSAFSAKRSLIKIFGSYPEPIQRMTEQVDQGFSPLFAKRVLSELEAALKADITPYCTQNITSGYPFLPTSPKTISPAIFGAFFGYGGKMDRFFETRLRAHTRRTAKDGAKARSLVAHDSPLGQLLLSALLDPFSIATNVRDAFFEPATSTPRVLITVSLITTSEQTEAIDIALKGATTRLQVGSNPVSILWAGNDHDVSVTLLPAQQGSLDDTLSVSTGPWAIFELLSSGAHHVNGNMIDATYTVGARTVTLRFTFEDTALPLLTSRLAEFTCPTASLAGLE